MTRPQTARLAPKTTYLVQLSLAPSAVHHQGPCMRSSFVAKRLAEHAWHAMSASSSHQPVGWLVQE